MDDATSTGLQAKRNAAKQQGCDADSTGLVWPTLDGLWPSRPNEPQWEWEPPRVIPSVKCSVGRIASWFSEWMDRSAKIELVNPTGMRGDVSSNGQQVKTGTKYSGEEVSEKILSGMRCGTSSPCSSYKWKQRGQFINKSDNSMRCLSCKMALEERQGRSWSSAMQSLRTAFAQTRHVSETLSAVQKVWRSITDEEKQWLAFQVGPCISARLNANRIQQLKCVGNAIVPSVAAIFLYAILQDIKRNSK